MTIEETVSAYIDFISDELASIQIGSDSTVFERLEEKTFQFFVRDRLINFSPALLSESNNAHFLAFSSEYINSILQELIQELIQELETNPSLFNNKRIILDVCTIVTNCSNTIHLKNIEWTAFSSDIKKQFNLDKCIQFYRKNCLTQTIHYFSTVDGIIKHSADFFTEAYNFMITEMIKQNCLHDLDVTALYTTCFFNACFCNVADFPRSPTAEHAFKATSGQYGHTTLSNFIQTITRHIRISFNTLRDYIYFIQECEFTPYVDIDGARFSITDFIKKTCENGTVPLNPPFNNYSTLSQTPEFKKLEHLVRAYDAKMESLELQKNYSAHKSRSRPAL